MSYKPAYHREYKAERSKVLKRNGICVDCGKEQAEDGHKLGEKCLAARRERWHRSKLVFRAERAA